MNSRHAAVWRREGAGAGDELMPFFEDLKQTTHQPRRNQPSRTRPGVSALSLHQAMRLTALHSHDNGTAALQTQAQACHDDPTQATKQGEGLHDPDVVGHAWTWGGPAGTARNASAPWTVHQHARMTNSMS